MLKINKRLSLSIIAILTLLAMLMGCSKTVTGDNLNEKLDLAVKYLSENKFEEAVLAYKEVIEIDPKGEQAYKGLSVAYSMMGEREQAEQALQDGLKKVADSKQLKLALAGLLVDTEAIKEAEAIYKEIIAADKKYIPVYLAYSKMLLDKDKPAEAISIIKTAIDVNKNEYQLHSLLAEIYLETGDQEKALAAIMQSLVLEANQSAAYKVIEVIYNEQWQDLVELANQLNQQNKIVQSEILRMLALYHQGEYQSLLNVFNGTNEALKDNPKALLLAAQAFYQLDRQHEGLALLAKINTKDIRDALLMAEFADYYLQSGDLKKAWELAIQGIELDETVAENYLVLYESYQEKNKDEANIWRVKCLLNSNLSVKQAEKQVQQILSTGTEQAKNKANITTEEEKLAEAKDKNKQQTVTQKPSQLPASIFTAGEKNFTVKGIARELDAETFTQNGVVFAPVTNVAEAIGIAPETVKWNDSLDVVTLTKGELNYSFKPGDIQVYSNVERDNYLSMCEMIMPSPPTMKNGLLYVPVQTVADCFGLPTYEESNMVTICLKPITVDDLSIGILKINSGMGEIYAHLGNPQSSSGPNPGPMFTNTLIYPGITITGGAPYDYEGNDIIEAIYELSITSSKFQTSRGIKVGDSLEKVFAAYGKVNLHPDGYYQYGLPSKWESYGYINFHVTNSKVSKVDIGVGGA